MDEAAYLRLKYLYDMILGHHTALTLHWHREPAEVLERELLGFLNELDKMTEQYSELRHLSYEIDSVRNSDFDRSDFDDLLREVRQLLGEYDEY